MAKFVDLAEKSNGPVMAETEKYYPTIRLTHSQFPMLKDVKIKEDFTVVAEAQVKGIHQYGNGDIEYTLELRKAVITEDDPEEVVEEGV